jgi:hypothetical protein
MPKARVAYETAPTSRAARLQPTKTVASTATWSTTNGVPSPDHGVARDLRVPVRGGAVAVPRGAVTGRARAIMRA